MLCACVYDALIYWNEPKFRWPVVARFRKTSVCTKHGTKFSRYTQLYTYLHRGTDQMWYSCTHGCTKQMFTTVLTNTLLLKNYISEKVPPHSGESGQEHTDLASWTPMSRTEYHMACNMVLNLVVDRVSEATIRILYLVFEYESSLNFVDLHVCVHFDNNSRVRCCVPDLTFDLVWFTDGLQYQTECILSAKC